MKLFQIAIIAAALGTAPAVASPAPSAPATSRPAAPFDLSRIQCNNPKFMAWMGTRLAHLTNSNGRMFSGQFTDAKILSATTNYADANKLICDVEVNTKPGGNIPTMRGSFTIRRFPNGKQTLSFHGI